MYHTFNMSFGWNKVLMQSYHKDTVLINRTTDQYSVQQSSWKFTFGLYIIPIQKIPKLEFWKSIWYKLPENCFQVQSTSQSMVKNPTNLHWIFKFVYCSFKESWTLYTHWALFTNNAEVWKHFISITTYSYSVIEL